MTFNISEKVYHLGKVTACAGVLAMALAYAGCSSEDMPATEPEGKDQKMILFGGATMKELSWHDGRNRGSRANEKEIPSAIPLDVGVFAFGDGANTTYIFNNQQIYHYLNTEYTSNPFDWNYPGTAAEPWPYTISAGTSVQRPWEMMRYRFFAYSPWYKSENVSVAAENFPGFNTFTWDKIPGFTAFDYVLSNEIVELDNREGTFTTTGNIVHFSMRHILAQIRFFFKMSKGYHQIRRIKLNSITITSAGKVKSATFNFKNNAWDETVHWSKEDFGTAAEVELKNSDTDQYYIPYEYPTDPFACVYVYPQDNFSEVTMKIDYEVYDSEGVRTRHSNLTNSVTIPNWTLLSGYYYDIKINIVPDYLYVLSDNDQDFDGYVIIKENTGSGSGDPNSGTGSDNPGSGTEPGTGEPGSGGGSGEPGSGTDPGIDPR